MKVSVTTTSPRLLLKWTPRAHLTGAVLMLGYCGFVLVDTWTFQRRATQDASNAWSERLRRTCPGSVLAGCVFATGPATADRAEWRFDRPY